MKKNEILEILKNNGIYEMINENRNLNEIFESIKEKNILTITYPTLKKYVNEDLGFEWNKKDRKWIQNAKHLKSTSEQATGSNVVQLFKESADNNFKIDSGAQIGFFVDEHINPKIEGKKLNSSIPSEILNNTDSDAASRSNTNSELAKVIESHLETIIKQINQINEYAKTSNKHKKADIDLLSMPYGKSIKKTISINDTLLEKIKTPIYDSFGVKGNDCEIIRLALCYLINNQQK